MPKVNCVFMPVIRPEYEQLVQWLLSCCSPGQQQAILVLIIDTVWSSEEREELTRVFHRSALANTMSLEFLDCNMSKEESFYIKDPKTPLDLEKFPYGQKSGPNLQFFISIQKIQSEFPQTQGAMLMEVDAFPLCSGWLDRLNKRLETLPKNVLIAGANYSGVSSLQYYIRDHLNGNSIYFLSSQGFGEFLEIWRGILLSSLHQLPHMAYDVVLNWYSTSLDARAYGRSKLALANERARSVLGGMSQNFHEPACEIAPVNQSDSDFNQLIKTRTCSLNDTLVNWGGAIENAEGFTFDCLEFYRIYPNALVAHGKCFINSAAVLRRIYQRRTDP